MNNPYSGRGTGLQNQFRMYLAFPRESSKFVRKKIMRWHANTECHYVPLMYVYNRATNGLNRILSKDLTVDRDSQEISRLLWNPKDHYCIQKVCHWTVPLARLQYTYLHHIPRKLISVISAPTCLLIMILHSRSSAKI
jgi:hypothetical protein